MFEKLIKDLIGNHQEKKTEQKELMDYYLGKHDILNRTIKNEKNGQGEQIKPNHKLVLNYSELIVEVAHSYLYGQPPTYSNKLLDNDPNFELTQDLLNEINNIYFDNDEEELTSSLLKSNSIYGEAVELHNIGENGDYEIIETAPTEWIFFQLGDGEEYALRYFNSFTYKPNKDGEMERVDFIKAEIYDFEKVTVYEQGEEGEFTKKKETFYKFGEYPVVRYKNKAAIGTEGQSDIKGVKSLIDAINLINSSSLNTLDYAGDPYLVLKNIGFNDEDIEAMREARVLVLNGDSETKAEFLEWGQNVEARETLLDRLEKSLFTLSFTPQLFDMEKVGSGNTNLAIKMMYSGLDIKTNARERTFKAGIKKRLKLIAKQMQNKTNKPYYDLKLWKHISIDFNRSIPQSLKELTEIANQLLPFLSKRTILEKVLPIIEDADQELALKEEEEGTAIDFGEGIE